MAASVDSFLEKMHANISRTALISNNREISYEELLRTIGRYRWELIAQGLKKGDMVGIMLGNNLAFACSLFAVWQIGGIIIPINTLYQQKEVEHIVRHSGLAGVIATPESKKVLPTSKRSNLLPGIDYYQFPQEPSHLEKAPEETALIIYSSGTTGPPKGVMLTFNNLLFNISAWLKVVGQNEEDTVLLSLPLFHIFGLTLTLLATLYIGGKGVILDRFSPEGAVDLITRYGVTIFPRVPAMFNQLLNTPGIDPKCLASVHFCVSGGAPLPGTLQNRFEEYYKVPIIEGYGLSETSPLVSVTPPAGKKKKGSVGPPIPHTTVRVVDRSGNHLPIGHIGEIIVKGPQVMKGYFRRHDVTQKTIQGEFLYTGDLGYFDADGYLFLVDRSKDLIITNGYNVYPREVEETITTKQEVQEAAVVGIADSRKGEAVKAYVVLRAGMFCLAQDIIDHCCQQIAPFKVPKEIEFIESLPKNSTGKVLKNVLRQNHDDLQPR